MKTTKIFISWKKKALYKYLPAALRTTLSTKFLLDTKLQKNGLWNISNLGIFLRSVILKMSFKSECNFWNTKTYRKFKFHVVWVELEKKICFLRQSFVDKCRKLNKTAFFFEIVYCRFFDTFLEQLSKFDFWVVGWPSIPIF